MPYYRCSECDLTVYSADRYSNRRACPDCSADLDTATPVYVGDAGAPHLRRPLREPNNADLQPLPSERNVGVGLESQTEMPGNVKVDPAAAIDLGWRWMDAANRCDIEALIDMAARDITLLPTRLVADARRYLGYDGIRQWVADLSTTGLAGVRRVTEMRYISPAELVVLGQIVVADRPLSPFSIVISLRDGKIAATRAYLSDEAELKRIGHLPD